MPPRTLNLDTLTLMKGSHPADQGLYCVMEAAAYIAGEPHSDSPDCVNYALTQFLRGWNDDLPTEERQQLKRFIPRIVNTDLSAAASEQVMCLLTDWVVRELLPAWMNAAGLHAQADTLARSPRILAYTQLDRHRTLAAAAYNAVATTLSKGPAYVIGDTSWTALDRCGGSSAARCISKRDLRDLAVHAENTARWAAELTGRNAAFQVSDQWSLPACAAYAKALEPATLACQQSCLALVDRMIDACKPAAQDDDDREAIAPGDHRYYRTPGAADR